MDNKDLMGYAAECLTKYRIVSYGYPTHECGGQTHIDLVIDVDGKLISVQVKAASKRNGSKYRFYTEHCRRSGRKQYSNIDIFALVAYDLELIHFVPSGKIDGLSITKDAADFSAASQRSSFEECISLFTAE